MPKTSSAQLYIKLPQFVAETTEGTTPTASPTFTSMGSVTSFGIKKGNNLIEVGQVGQEDLLGLATGLTTFEFQVKFQLVNSTFLKRCINAANYVTPAGTISESFSVIWSQYLDGVENFFFAKGSRCKDTTLNFETGKPIEVTSSFETMNVTKPSTSHGLTTPSFASNPTGPVWDWLSGGANPVSWNSIALNCKKFSVTVNRNTKPDHTLGNTSPFSTQPHARRIGGDFNNLHTATEATTLETDSNAQTARTLAAVLKSAVSTLTVSNTIIDNYSRDDGADDTDAAIETVAYKALTCTVT